MVVEHEQKFWRYQVKVICKGRQFEDNVQHSLQDLSDAIQNLLLKS